MPCGCAKKKSGVPAKFNFTPPPCPDCKPGETQPALKGVTEIEARAAKIRAGGGTVEPA